MNKQFFFKAILLILGIVIFTSCSKERKVYSQNDINILPKPAKVSLKSGSFLFNDNTVFVTTNKEQENVIKPILQQFKNASGLNLKVVDSKPASNFVALELDEQFKNEAYSLESASNSVIIKANSYNGFIYGVQSLRQLLPVAIESSTLQKNIEWSIPNVTINDAPRFKWRGLMLDVSRHFFEKDYIIKTIDRLALHKMNVLHLHLVDDQGWRIEIKKYPKLSSVGGFRVNQEDAAWSARQPNKAADEATFGGFYTQDEIKEIVTYAISKGVEIIPEIEMPAHVMSAVAAYPEVSCFEEPIGVPSGGVWPITDIYCAGKDSTFEFLENILVEVMDLFPSKYVHIGGDEATKTNWAKCPHCKKRMKSEGLHDVEELQSYFIKRIEKFINSKGKRLIGWDEILEGGLAPDATVMSWRGVKGGVEAAKQGHDVVMTPTSHCYFDYYQGPQNEEPLAWGGYTPLSKVYKFNPIVKGMTPEEEKHVLGGQANLWSEYVPTDKQSEYMIYPRIAAMSEALWSPIELRNWEDFSKRVEVLFDRYNYHGINFAKSAYLVTADAKINLETKQVEVTLKNEFPNSDIRYTLNDVSLNSTAKEYNSPIQLSETTTIHASLFKNDKPIGKQFNKIIKFHKAVGKKVTYKEKPSQRYNGSGDSNMVNSLRGSKNFHDGNWQAWISKDMEISIDLESIQEISKVTVGTMENQGPGIYYPIEIVVSISNDGKSFEKVGSVKRAYAKNGNSELKDFEIDFDTVNGRFVQVKAINMKRTPSGGGVWLFVDEILIE